MLKIRPCYNIRNWGKNLPVKSGITTHAKASECYHKLKDFLAISLWMRAPGGYNGEWALFQTEGIAYYAPICWMPFLKEQWRRLTYEEFVEAYQLDIVEV